MKVRQKRVIATLRRPIFLKCDDIGLGFKVGLNLLHDIVFSRFYHVSDAVYTAFFLFVFV